MLYPHHLRVVERLVELYQNDPRFPALIVGGSLVKGYGDENSDVDIMLVATDEEYAKRAATQEFWYFNRELCDYPDGYVDGKIIDQSFLRDVAAKGSDTARWAFSNAFLAYSRLPGLEDLLATIPVFQEAEREKKILSFYTHAQLMVWFVGEAEKRNNTYLMMHTVSKLILFGSRTILAYNRMLYPYHKWMLRVLSEAPDKPADLMARIDQLLAQPSLANAQAFFESIKQFRDWGIPDSAAPTRFMIDSEWTWRDGRAPVEDW